MSVYSIGAEIEAELHGARAFTQVEPSVGFTVRRRTDVRSETHLRAWVVRLVALDAAAALLASLVGFLTRIGIHSDTVGHSIDSVYSALLVGSVPVWLVTMALAGAYESRFIAAGAEQYRRVVNGTVWVLAVAAFASFALRADLSRAFVLVSIPLAAALTLGGRFGSRRILHHQFASGKSVHRVLVIGRPADVDDLVIHMHRAYHAGFRVVAALTPGEPTAPRLPPGVAWVGSSLDDLVQTTKDSPANTIVVAAPHFLAPGSLRRLSWELEGTDIELVLAPAITDIAGPRIRSRPIDGLPLLCVEKPQFAGPQRFVKAAIDRAVSCLGLIVLSPLLLTVAVLIRLSESGPVLYRQTRVGLGAQPFALFKFRSMRTGADAEQSLLMEQNETGGMLFKIHSDPRVTTLGRFLRRYSIDELPQLWNVVRGDMSLVGPRPPLPTEVERYGPDVHRRLLVKPGITGLWQVSGRSDLTWEETVRLDLHYVDNWSVGLDLVLMWKTLACVARGRGAY